MAGRPGRSVQGTVWTDLWFRDIRLSGYDSAALELHVAGESPGVSLPVRSEPVKPEGPPSRARTSAELAELFQPPPNAGPEPG